MKVAIFGGGGGVGSSAAFNLLIGRDAHDVVLVDRRPEMVTSHVMDLEQVLEQGGTGSISGGDLSDVVDSDIVVVAASAPLTVNVSRLEYLTANAEIVEELVSVLARADSRWPGTLVVVTNPVDPLCNWIQRRTGIDRTRVLGYTLNDSLRLRTGIAKALRADPGTVDAWVLGEHGDACVPLFDRVRVGGGPVGLTPEVRAEAEEFLRTWYVRHVALDSGRSSTWTSGLGVAAMVDAVVNGAEELWPVSLVLEGEYGVEGVALSVPVALRDGMAVIQEWPLSQEEREALEHASELVADATERVAAQLEARVAGGQ